MLIPKTPPSPPSTLVGDVTLSVKQPWKIHALTGDVTLTGEVEIKDSEIKGDVNIYGCRYEASRRETQVKNSAIEETSPSTSPTYSRHHSTRNITITGMFVTGQRCVFSGNLNLKTRTLKELYGKRIHGIPRWKHTRSQSARIRVVNFAHPPDSYKLSYRVATGEKNVQHRLNALNALLVMQG